MLGRSARHKSAALDGLEQRFEPNGFAKNGCGIDRQLLTRVVSRDHDDRNLVELGIGQLLLAKFPSVHDGHHQVEQDERRKSRHAASKELERRAAIFMGRYLETFVLEDRNHRGAYVRVILDDEKVSLINMVMVALRSSDAVPRAATGARKCPREGAGGTASLRADSRTYRAGIVPHSVVRIPFRFTASPRMGSPPMRDCNAPPRI